MKKITNIKSIIIISCIIILLFIVSFLFNMYINGDFDIDAKTLASTIKFETKDIKELREQIEKDEADYGDDYLEFESTVYKRKPDRIIFKDGDKDGFYLFEKDDENYEHLLEVSEDRMSYSVMQDFNLWCFTPDSIDTMMKSGENYIIFDFDNGNLVKGDMDYQKDLVFRFSENNRLYRLVTYLSYYKDLVSREDLPKKEFADDTELSGYKYMMYEDYRNIMD